MSSPTRYVLSTDGVSLAVYETGDQQKPRVVAVHGYPDDHTVWDGVVALLADDFHVVTYDVRGAGASGAPKARAGYRIPQLVDDLAAVIDAVTAGAGDERVHLLAHDWGSIQSWGAVTDQRFGARLKSFTSISGPSLDMAGAWLRGGHPIASLRQLAASYYIGLFQAPFLPEAMVRAGVVDKLVALSAGAGASHGAAGTQPRPTRDLVNGLELYRANFLGKMARPTPGRAVVPVQVLAPTHDPHVTSRLQREAPVPYVDTLLTHEIDGNHWVIAQRPEVIARHLRDFVSYVG